MKKHTIIDLYSFYLYIQIKINYGMNEKLLPENDSIDLAFFFFVVVFVIVKTRFLSKIISRKSTRKVGNIYIIK